MSQNSRLVLAMVLMAIVFIGYEKWFAPPLAPTPPAAVESQTEATPLAEQQPATPPPVSENASTPLLGGASSNVGIASSGDVEWIENDQVRISYDKKTGSIQDWILKDYHTGTTPDTPLINLLEDHSAIDATWQCGEETQKAVVSKVNPTAQGVEIYGSQGVVQFKKIYAFDAKNKNRLDVTVELTNASSQPVCISPNLTTVRKQNIIEKKSGLLSMFGPPSDLFLPVYLKDNKVEHIKDWDKMTTQSVSGSIPWAGIADRYFMLGSISRLSSSTQVDFGKTGESLYSRISYGTKNLEGAQKNAAQYSLYLGSKKRNVLESFGISLEKAVDYGMFSFIAIPLLWSLQHIYNFVGNWGLAIIALTFIVKLLLHPVNKKSMQSMKAMQKLQPEMKKIQEKYKGDREKLNMEMMQLFKTHKVNPMGGCLPLLAQMPIYFALYQVFWNAVELYHAPFYGFYRDLSAPDPYLISPILLGIFMFLQQKLTPTSTSMDPAQQKAMMIMPLFFSVFMLWLPFGLVLYILVNTVISVVQQYMVHNDLNTMTLLKKLIPSSSNAA